jgi:hypothetical protein
MEDSEERIEEAGEYLAMAPLTTAVIPRIAEALTVRE